MIRTYEKWDLEWLEQNNFTQDPGEGGRWNGCYVPNAGWHDPEPNQFFDLTQSVDGSWIAVRYEYDQYSISWSNAGLGFSRAKDAYMDAELRDWGRLSASRATNTGVFENPQPDDPLFCRMYEIGFQYTGEGDWAINLGEYATGYLHYSGPGAGCESWVTDTPEWQGQINGGTPGPRHGDLLAAAVWVKLEAGRGA